MSTAARTTDRRGPMLTAFGLACVAWTILMPRPVGTDADLWLFGRPTPSDTIPAPPRLPLRGYVCVRDPAAAGVVLDHAVDVPLVTATPALNHDDGSAPGCVPIALAAYALAVETDLPRDDAGVRRLVHTLGLAADTKPTNPTSSSTQPDNIPDGFAAFGFDAALRDGHDVAGDAAAALATGRPLLISFFAKRYGFNHAALVTGVGRDASGATVLRLAPGWPNVPVTYVRLLSDVEQAANPTGGVINLTVPASPVSRPQSPG